MHVLNEGIVDILIGGLICLTSGLFTYLDCKMRQKRVAFFNLNGYGKSKILGMLRVAFIFLIKGLLKFPDSSEKLQIEFTYLIKDQASNSRFEIKPSHSGNFVMVVSKIGTKAYLFCS